MFELVEHKASGITIRAFAAEEAARAAYDEAAASLPQGEIVELRSVAVLASSWGEPPAPD